MFQELLRAEFAPYAELTLSQLHALENHYQLLLRWNKVLNLTRITDLEEAVRLHYCESLFLASKLPAETLRIVDVGSGAGFPGFPTAVFRNDCAVDLVESDQRKSVFLREATRALPNVRVVAQRAESVRSRYDWLVGRAVRADELLKLKLAQNSAILMSKGDLPSGGVAIDIPWGKNHILATFHVKH